MLFMAPIRFLVCEPAAVMPRSLQRPLQVKRPSQFVPLEIQVVNPGPISKSAIDYVTVFFGRPLYVNMREIRYVR